jgi:hypothetical protein
MIDLYANDSGKQPSSRDHIKKYQTAFAREAKIGVFYSNATLIPPPWGNRGRNRLLGQEVLMRWHPPQGADAMRAGTAQRE